MILITSCQPHLIGRALDLDDRVSELGLVNYVWIPGLDNVDAYALPTVLGRAGGKLAFLFQYCGDNMCRFHQRYEFCWLGDGVIFTNDQADYGAMGERVRMLALETYRKWKPEMCITRHLTAGWLLMTHCAYWS